MDWLVDMKEVVDGNAGEERKKDRRKEKNGGLEGEEDGFRRCDGIIAFLVVVCFLEYCFLFYNLHFYLHFAFGCSLFALSMSMLVMEDTAVRNPDRTGVDLV